MGEAYRSFCRVVKVEETEKGAQTITARSSTSVLPVYLRTGSITRGSLQRRFSSASLYQAVIVRCRGIGKEFEAFES